MELPICPACGEELEPGKHHNKCKAGRTTNPPSKRVSKVSTTGTKSTKLNRGSGGHVKKKVKREAQPKAVETASGNSYAEAVACMPESAAIMLQPHEGAVAVGLPQHVFTVCRIVWKRRCLSHVVVCLVSSGLLACQLLCQPLLFESIYTRASTFCSLACTKPAPFFPQIRSDGNMHGSVSIAAEHRK